MGAAIFGAMTVMWIAYLVPWFVNRRHEEVEDVQATPDFPDTMNVVVDEGLTISSPVDEEGRGVEVSTPYTRSAARRDMRRSWSSAARRRRNTLLVLTGLTLVAVVLALTIDLSWWVAGGCGLAVVAFLAVARISVVSMARRFDKRMELIDRGWDEETVVLGVDEPFRRPDADYESTEYSIELNRPVQAPAGSLWEAVPVTAPTYVSKPLAARTVRTIDLSAPGPVPGQTEAPVTAQAPDGRMAGARVDEGDSADEARESA